MNTIKVSSLFVFNPSLGNEFTEGEKILAFYPDLAFSDQKFYVGLCEGLSAFAGEFSRVVPLDYIQTEKYHIGLAQVEPDFYIGMMLDNNAYFDDHDGQGDLANPNLHLYDSPTPRMIINYIIQHLYNTFTLINDNMLNIYLTQTMCGLRDRLSLFLTYYIPLIPNIIQTSASAAFNPNNPTIAPIPRSLSYNSVDRSTYLMIQFFINSLSHNFPYTEVLSIFYTNNQPNNNINDSTVLYTSTSTNITTILQFITQSTEMLEYIRLNAVMSTRFIQDEYISKIKLTYDEAQNAPSKCCPTDFLKGWLSQNIIDKQLQNNNDAIRNNITYNLINTQCPSTYIHIPDNPKTSKIAPIPLIITPPIYFNTLTPAQPSTTLTYYNNVYNESNNNHNNLQTYQLQYHKNILKNILHYLQSDFPDNTEYSLQNVLYERELANYVKKVQYATQNTSTMKIISPIPTETTNTLIETTALTDSIVNEKYQKYLISFKFNNMTVVLTTTSLLQNDDGDVNIKYSSLHLLDQTDSKSEQKHRDSERTEVQTVQYTQPFPFCIPDPSYFEPIEFNDDNDDYNKNDEDCEDHSEKIEQPIPTPPPPQSFNKIIGTTSLLDHYYLQLQQFVQINLNKIVCLLDASIAAPNGAASAYPSPTSSSPSNTLQYVYYNRFNHATKVNNNLYFSNRNGPLTRCIAEFHHDVLFKSHFNYISHVSGYNTDQFAIPSALQITSPFFGDVITALQNKKTHNHNTGYDPIISLLYPSLYRSSVLLPIGQQYLSPPSIFTSPIPTAKREHRTSQACSMPIVDKNNSETNSCIDTNMMEELDFDEYVNSRQSRRTRGASQVLLPPCLDSIPSDQITSHTSPKSLQSSSYLDPLNEEETSPPESLSMSSKPALELTTISPVIPQNTQNTSQHVKHKQYQKQNEFLSYDTILTTPTSLDEINLAYKLMSPDDNVNGFEVDSSPVPFYSRFQQPFLLPPIQSLLYFDYFRTPKPIYQLQRYQSKNKLALAGQMQRINMQQQSHYATPTVPSGQCESPELDLDYYHPHRSQSATPNPFEPIDFSNNTPLVASTTVLPHFTTLTTLQHLPPCPEHTLNHIQVYDLSQLTPQMIDDITSSDVIRGLLLSYIHGKRQNVLKWLALYDKYKHRQLLSTIDTNNMNYDNNTSNNKDDNATNDEQSELAELITTDELDISSFYWTEELKIDWSWIYPTHYSQPLLAIIASTQKYIIMSNAALTQREFYILNNSFALTPSSANSPANNRNSTNDLYYRDPYGLYMQPVAILPELVSSMFRLQRDVFKSLFSF